MFNDKESDIGQTQLIEKINQIITSNDAASELFKLYIHYEDYKDEFVLALIGSLLWQYKMRCLNVKPA